MAVTLGSKNVGDIVKLKENGTPVEFLIVHKGLPPTYYDASCDGVWLLRKEVYPKQWIGNQTDYSGNGKYENSPVDTWLGNTYFNMFDSDTKTGIKYVCVRYMHGDAQNPNVSSAWMRCFILSQCELGYEKYASATQPDFSSKLSYFSEANESLNIARRKTGVKWLTRDTMQMQDGYYGTTIGLSGYIDEEGYIGGFNGANEKAVYVRPAMIFDYNATVNADGSITVNTAPSTPGNISVPGSIQGGSTITVSWSSSSDAQGNLEGYKLERSINGGAWSQVYQGSGTSATNYVAFGTNTVTYRVKAYDTMGAESGYRTSAAVTVLNNTPPGTPQGITVPVNVRGGNPITISWGGSADAENNLAGYELERSVNGGAWSQVFRGAQLSHADNITFGWQTVAYRVRAYDAYSAYSGYATSETRAVDNNRPPQIVCAFQSGSDLGIKSSGFSFSYTVNDTDNRTGDVTVTETLNGTKRKEFQPELGAENTFTVDGQEFQCLPNGKHSISIAASDGKEAATYTLAFTKEVTSACIMLETPRDADNRIKVCALAVSGYIPEDALYRVLVTNNAKDMEPEWEDCTQAVKNGANYLFSNQTAENGFAFNFKISVSRGESGTGGYITSVQGGFQ